MNPFSPTSRLPRTLLVVDDQASVRLALEFALGTAGFRVGGADSVPHALALMAKERFEGALIDIHMPGIDGFETCRRLQAEAEARGQSLIVWFMTAVAGSAVARRAAELGARGVFRKPFDHAELVAQLEAGFAAAEAAPAALPTEPVPAWRYLFVRENGQVCGSIDAPTRQDLVLAEAGRLTIVDLVVGRAYRSQGEWQRISPSRLSPGEETAPAFHEPLAVQP